MVTRDYRMLNELPPLELKRYKQYVYSLLLCAANPNGDTDLHGTTFSFNNIIVTWKEFKEILDEQIESLGFNW